MPNTDINRIATDPSTILLSLRDRIISVMGLNDNVVYLTIDPDLLLLVPKEAFYITLYEAGIKSINPETIYPPDLTTLLPEASCEMDIMVTLFLNHASDQAQKLNSQLTNSITLKNGLYPQIAAVVASLHMYDPTVNAGANLLFAEPCRLVRKERTTHYKGLTESNRKGQGITNPYFSQTKLFFTLKFLYDVSSIISP